jgi:hypothetical protein
MGRRVGNAGTGADICSAFVFANFRRLTRSTKFPAPLKKIAPDKSLGTQGGMTKL